MTLSRLLFVSLFAGMFSFLFSPLRAQCLIHDTLKLDRFYLDSLATNSWDEFETSIVFADRDSYVGDQKKFFDSLGVITFDSALEIACKEKGHTVYGAVLFIAKDPSKSYWELEGAEHVRFGGHGPGNATITEKVLTLDAKTGKVIKMEKRKYRAMVDF